MSLNILSGKVYASICTVEEGGYCSGIPFILYGEKYPRETGFYYRKPKSRGSTGGGIMINSFGPVL